MWKPNTLQHNCFYIIQDNIAKIYVEIPKNPVLKKHQIIYEDGAISNDVSIALAFSSTDIQDIKSKYLHAIIK